jgi:hypothetical protein
MAGVMVERRAAVRSQGEDVRQLVQLKELQHHFVGYRSKLEVATEALRDIAQELHGLEVRAAERHRAGHFATSLGSGVVGGALVGGLVTANPLVSAGLLVGTVLTTAGGVIVMADRQKKRSAELQLQVTAILASLEREYEQCQRGLQQLDGPLDGLEQLRLRLEVAERGKPGRGHLKTLYRILANISTFAEGLQSRREALPREVRGLLEQGLAQVQYFISPYGATALVGLLKGGAPPGQPVPPAAGTGGPGLAEMVGQVGPPTAPAAGKGNTLFSSCGKLGKVAYTVGAVGAVYQLYTSVAKTTELTKRLQRLRDSSDLLKYEGPAKDVFNISLDLQLILSTVFKEEGTEE